MKLKVDTKDIAKMHAAVTAMNERGIPHAARDALNNMAFQGRLDWQAEMRSAFTLRNKFTERSIAVDKAKGVNMRRMESRLGSRAPYMETQEEGGTVTSDGKHGVTIPTAVASGQAMGTEPRKRPVRKRHWMSRIELKNRAGSSRKQRNAVAIRQAKASGRKHVFLDLGDTKGMFVVKGGKRKPRVEMVWDMTRPAVRIPREPTLKRTVGGLDRKAPGMMLKALRKQMAFIMNKRR